MTNAAVSLPLHTTVSIISKCNLNCVYCYAQPFGGDVMPVEDVKALLAQLHDDGVFMIKLAGGEPLVHPDIFEILEFIAERRIPIALLSNGTVFDGAQLERLAELLLESPFIDFQVSLDSIDPKENDYLRGLTSRAVATIDCLASKGIEVQIATVLTQKNIDSVERLIEYFFPRVRKFHFMNLMPTPKAISTYRDLVLTTTQLEELWRDGIRKMKARFGERLVLSAEAHIKDAEVDGREVSCTSPGCLAAVTFVDIDANMDVLACNCANAFKLGNLRQSSLKDVFNSHLADRVRAFDVPLCHFYREAAESQGHDKRKHGELLQIIPVEELLSMRGF